MEMYLNKGKHTPFDVTTFPKEIRLEKDGHTTFVTRESRNITIINFPSGKCQKN